MLRSMYSGISGMRAQQTMMDVVGNNIANVNTTGFKSSQTVFQDTLSQLVKGAGAPQASVGGTNPTQIGLGVRLATIAQNFGQGAAQTTGRSTDLMIQGDGFFCVRNAGENLYTRAGAFSFDATGRLVTPDGAMVQGWNADATGKINTNATTSDIRLPLATVLAPKATQNITLAGNLPADAAIDGTPIVTSIDVYDDQGVATKVNASFTKVSDTTWSLSVTDGAAGTTPVTSTLTVQGNGASIAPQTLAFQGMNLDLTGITAYAGKSSVAAGRQDGSAMGSLQAFSMSADGTLVGVFSNGLRQSLGQVALANFSNPNGLEKVAGTMFRPTANSGNEQIGVAGAGGRGQLASGTLEMSNVDLAQEFTNLIVAQRGFQANSKVITASDEILQDLVNLKR